MRFLWIILLILQSLGPANSQQHYYIYIQTDNQQPFYSSIGKEVFSSSASGFIIIPRLRDSVYQITIGFPAQKWPDYIFNCSINRKDRGFLLKNFNEKGWGLFNLQTLEVTMGTKVEKPIEQKSNSLLPPTNDEFTVILASVVDDAELRRTALIPKDEMTTAVAKEDVKKDENKQVESKKEIENKEAVAIVPSKTDAEVSTAREGKGEAPAANSSVKKEETNSTIAAGTTVIANQSRPTSGNKPTPDTKVASDSKPVSDTKVASENKTASDSKPTSDTKSASENKAASDKQKTTDSTFSTEPLFTKVSRMLQYSNKEGTEIIYVDEQLNGEKDTVRIFIPTETAAVAQAVSPGSNANNLSNAKDEKKDGQFLDMAIAPKKESSVQETTPAKNLNVHENVATTDTASKSKKVESQPAATLPEKKDTAAILMEEKKSEPSSSPVAKANCKKMATDKDVSALRSKMIVIKDDDDIVNLALKSFKQKCYSSENIKALSYVFITDQGKYKLMDAAYPYVYDQENFASLAFLLTDTYYVNRFSALVKNN